MERRGAVPGGPGRRSPRRLGASGRRCLWVDGLLAERQPPRNFFEGRPQRYREVLIWEGRVHLEAPREAQVNCAEDRWVGEEVELLIGGCRARWWRMVCAMAVGAHTMVAAYGPQQRLGGHWECWGLVKGEVSGVAAAEDLAEGHAVARKLIRVPLWAVGT